MGQDGMPVSISIIVAASILGALLIAGMVLLGVLLT